MLYLTIDQGNSAAKLALWQADTLVHRQIVPRLSPDTLHTLMQRHQGQISAAIYGSVASRGTEVMALLDGYVPRVMRLSGDTPVPLRINYGKQGSLGVDRIAASVGALAIAPGKPLLVVDAGTAVTYDFVEPDGTFVGGNIAPGMKMRLEALHQFTARLPRVEVPRSLQPVAPCFGTDTPSAMIRGAVYGIIGAISYYRSRLPNDTLVVMTGGWADELSRLCEFPTRVEGDLVSIGLNKILHYNEDK